MKKIILIVISIFVTFIAVSQKLELSSVFSYSNNKSYQPSFGYGLTYMEEVRKRHFLGLGFYNLFCNNQYDVINPDNTDGVSYLIKKIDNNSTRYSFRIVYSYNVISDNKIDMYLGADFGLNYFISKTNVHCFPNGNNQETYYLREYKKNNRLGFGGIIGFEIKEIFTPQLSITSIIRPEIVFYEKFGLEGIQYKPVMIFLDLQIGIRYNFKFN